MNFSRLAVPAAALLLSAAAVSAQDSTPVDAAPADATPVATGGAADWLGPVDCRVNRHGFRMTCATEAGVEIVACTASRGGLFPQGAQNQVVEPFDGVGHPCVEQGADQVCIYSSGGGWKCGSRDERAYKVVAMTRHCAFFENRAPYGGFDCRIYDQETGTKAHLVRCTVKGDDIKGMLRITCTPIQRSPASWL